MTLTLKRKLLNDLRGMVQRNDHGSAYQLAANALGSTELETRFERINRLCAEVGHISLDLYEERHGLYLQLMALARKSLTTSDYQRFYISF